MPAVEVESLVVRYGGLVAVDGISFTAEHGEVTAVLGPNGAGKTSTVEVLEGYRRPHSGRVRVLDLDPVADHARLVPRIGVMLQQGGIYPGIRAGEAVELFCALYRHRHDSRELLDAVGLTDRARSTWRQLSGGEQQRLSLALALAGRPEVAFLDEPTSGLDVTGRQRLRQVIRDLAEAGCGVLLTTHELDEAERLADRVVIVDRGRLVAAGTPDELRAIATPGEIRFAASPGLDVAALATALDAPVAEVSVGEYVVATPPTPAAVVRLTSWMAEHDVALGDLRAGRATLEDVFLRLTGDAAEGSP